MQFATGPGKLAEDQHTIFIPALHHEFLGQQIHAWMERGDQAKIRGLIVGLNFLMTVMTAEKNDGLPSFRLQSRVDTIGLGRNLRDKVLITLDIRAAGSAELDKRELLLVVRKLVQKSFDSPEPLHDSLRVIDTIHADSKKQCFRSQLRQNVRAVLLRGNAQLGLIHMLRLPHADRMGPNQSDLATP